MKDSSLLFVGALTILMVTAWFSSPVRASHDSVTSHVISVIERVRGNIGVWAFGAVEDDPSTDTVVYSVFADVAPFDREDLADLIRLAMTGATCSFPVEPTPSPDCIIETTNPSITYLLDSPDSFALTFEFAP